MSLKKKLGKFGSRFAFEMFLEMERPHLLEAFRRYLSSIRPEDIAHMVKECQFPPMETLDFSAVSDNADQLANISALRLMDFIAEARPDLAQVIQDMGYDGACYIFKLREHLLERVEHPEKPMAGATTYEAPEATVMGKCDRCGKSFPMPKDNPPDKCPFCGK